MDLGTAKAEHFGIGDTVTISFNNAKVPKDRFRIVGVAKFGDADRPAGATVALFTLAEAQRRQRHAGPARRDLGRGEAGREPGSSWSAQIKDGDRPRGASRSSPAPS